MFYSPTDPSLQSLSDISVTHNFHLLTCFQHCCSTSLLHLPSYSLSFFFQHHLAAAARSHHLCLCTWVTTTSPLLCCILLLLILSTSSSSPFLFTLCAALLLFKNNVFTISFFKDLFCVHEYWLVSNDDLITWSERELSAFCSSFCYSPSLFLLMLMCATLILL